MDESVGLEGEDTYEESCSRAVRKSFYGRDIYLITGRVAFFDVVAVKL